MLTFLFCLAGLAADIMLQEFLFWGSWSPDILLVVVLYCTFTSPVGEVYLSAFFIGFLWDIIFLDVIGLHSFLFVCAAMIIVRFRLMFLAHYALTRFLAGFVFSFMYRFSEVIIWLSNLDKDVPIILPEKYVLHGAISTGIFFFFFFPMRSRPIKISKQTPSIVFTNR